MVDLSPDIRWYLGQQFAEHLQASDVEPSEEILPDHPIWSFLDHLCQIVYYLPAFDSDPHLYQTRDVWFLIAQTLHWVQRHQEVGLANYPVRILLTNTIHFSSSSGSRTCTAICNINSIL